MTAPEGSFAKAQANETVSFRRRRRTPPIVIAPKPMLKWRITFAHIVGNK
jgi:hypothetical protein